MNRFIRNEMLFTKKGQEYLSTKKVALFGVGGVGGYVAEMLARSGVGAIELIDHDTISKSNINRQIIALDSTVGALKVDVMKQRISEINPNCQVTVKKLFYLPETENQFDFSSFDYIVDAIDTVSGKIAIIENAVAHRVPVISSMGTGNKLHPELLEIADISKTSVCPLARVMRRELKNRNIRHIPVLFSKEPPIKPEIQEGAEEKKGRNSLAPASSPFVPSAAGILIASYVIRSFLAELTEECKE